MQLLSPGRIGTLETRNRIVAAATGSYLAREDGHPSPRLKRHYEERARGGAGLVVVEVAAVDFPRGAAMTHQLGLSDDVFIPDLAELVQGIHRHGARAAIQLQHAGKIAVRDLADGRPLSVPSAEVGPSMAGVLDDLTREEIAAVVGGYKPPAGGSLVHELDEAEIRTLVSRFADAAARVQRAGFDGIELHAGHGYLLAEFLSPASNRRHDAWGGSHANRTRFLREVIAAVRESVGREFALWCRLDGREVGIENGISTDEARETAVRAVDAGLDAVHVSAYGGPSGAGFTEMIVHARAGLLPLAAGIKAHVDVPVIAVGRLTPDAAEEAIASGKADFVAMARPLLADPELPKKLAEGRREDIRPCIYCYTCVGQIFLGREMKCAVNPAATFEDEFAIEPAATSRHVVVVGGGPAGLEAARVAALRGHRVTLIERERRLGGTFHFASVVYAENQALVDWLVTQVRKLPVEVRLGVEATAEGLAALAPDAVVVATGARREPSKIPGADAPHVFSGDGLRRLLSGDAVGSDGATRLLLAAGSKLGLTGRADRIRRLSRVWMPLGRHVAIVGGGLVGLELAEFLVERRRRVSVLEEGPVLGVPMAVPRRWRTLHHLRAAGADLRTEVCIRRIDTQAVVVTDPGGAESRIRADAVILAAAVSPDRRLADALDGAPYAVHRIGDCDTLGYAEGAIAAGAEIGRAL